MRHLPLPDLVEGRLCDVYKTRVDQWPHVPEEQGQQQGRDMLPVDVRVRHADDLVVSNLAQVELLGDARPDRGDERPDFLVLQHLIEPRLLDVQDLPAEWEDRLEFAAAALFGRTARGWPFDDEQLRFRGVSFLAISELPRQVESLQEA